MSKEEATEELEIGSLVRFTGYDEEPDEEVFQEGDILEITSEEDSEGAYDVKRLSDGAEDGVFPEEVEALSEEEAEEQREYAEESKADAKKTAKEDRKAKRVLKARGGKKQESEEEEEEEEEKAPAKKAAKKATSKKAPAKKVAKKAPPAKKAPSKKAPAKKAAKQKEEEPKKDLVLSTSAKKAIGRKDPVKVAFDLQRKASSNDFILGGVLAKIQDEKLYEDFEHPVTGEQVSYEGAEGFGKFTEEFLGTGYRKARYLIGIHRAYAGTGVDEDRVAQIPWSKLKETVDIASKLLEEEKEEDRDFDTMEEVLEECEGKSIEDLSKSLDSIRKDLKITRTGSSSSSGDGKKATFKFAFFNDESKEFEAGLDEAMEEIEEEDDDTEARLQAKALLYIVDQWQQLRG